MKLIDTSSSLTERFIITMSYVKLEFVSKSLSFAPGDET